MKNVVVEGARGLGKTSITRYLRDKTTNSTLINYTGFNESGEEGCDKIVNYYSKWSEFFNSLRVEDMTFIHDRYFFSEMVYSSLYKSYNFRPFYDMFVHQIPLTFDELTVVFLYTTRPDELLRNLHRDKAQLFGKVNEDVTESLAQQLRYLQLAKELKATIQYKDQYSKMQVVSIDVGGKSVEEVGEEILALM